MDSGMFQGVLEYMLLGVILGKHFCIFSIFTMMTHRFPALFYELQALSFLPL